MDQEGAHRGRGDVTRPMDTPADVVRCLLTALFALVALPAWRSGARVPRMGRRDRVDRLLHVAMAVAMATMPWNPDLSPSGPAVTVLFTAAAAWFPLTALHRRTGSVVGAIVGRLPAAAGMAAMAWMLLAPHGLASSSHNVLTGGVLVAHHAATAGHAAGAPASADAVTVVLAVYLLACGVWRLNPLPPVRSDGEAAPRAPAAGVPYGHLRQGAMALGTAVMLFMPH